jgi:hypothetical protein
MILAAVACLQLPSTARAAANTGWLLNGAPLGTGQTAFLGEIGWPGLQLSILHGESANFDLGGFFAFEFGFEGIPSASSAPGFKFAPILRFHLTETRQFDLGLRLTPGVALYFPSGSSVVFGLSLPFELVGGLTLNPQLSVHFGFSIPFAVFMTPSTVVLLPLMPGFGVEYKFDPAFSLTFDTRFGPAVDLTHSTNTFAFRMLLGVGYRF